MIFELFEGGISALKYKHFLDENVWLSFSFPTVRTEDACAGGPCLNANDHIMCLFRFSSVCPCSDIRPHKYLDWTQLFAVHH